MSWESVIGLEVHVQLATRSKIFSGASTRFGAAPNTQACPVDLGLPGVLPVTQSTKPYAWPCVLDSPSVPQINRRSVFDRKNYFYPDLPKGYQISQFASPMVGRGTLTVQLEGQPPAQSP